MTKNKRNRQKKGPIIKPFIGKPIKLDDPRSKFFEDMEFELVKKKPIITQSRHHDKEEPILPWTEQEKRHFTFVMGGAAIAFIIIAIIGIIISR